MSWNKDIALDEINKFPVEGDFKDFLVAKTYEFFGEEQPVPVESDEASLEVTEPAPAEPEPVAPVEDDGA